MPIYTTQECIRDLAKRKLYREQILHATDDCHQTDFDPKLIIEPVWYIVKWISGGGGSVEEKGETHTDRGRETQRLPPYVCLWANGLLCPDFLKESEPQKCQLDLWVGL